MNIKGKYILLIECFAKRIFLNSKNTTLNRSSRGSRYVDMELELPSGSLLEEMSEELGTKIFGENDDFNTIYLKSLDHKDSFLSCLKSEVEQLTTFESEILFPVKPFSDRLKLFMDDSILVCVDHVDIGDFLEVELEGLLHSGVLRYKGPVPEKVKHGILFGVDLEGYEAEGGCDGSIGAKRYFSCAPKSGLFLPVAHIRSVRSFVSREPRANHAPNLKYSACLKDTTGSSSSKSKSSIKQKASIKASSNPPYEITDQDQNYPLVIGDRVVWVSDEGPEYGYVRWVGKLPDAGDDWMVGVEFDNPVGVGTGNYNDLQLFVAPINHAAIIPIMGLMKAKDFQVSLPPNTKQSSLSKDNHHNLQGNNQSCSRFSINDNIPSSMFVPHEDHPLTQAIANQESSTDYDHGSLDAIGISRGSIPYLPSPLTHRTYPRNYQPGVHQENSSGLPGYASDNYNQDLPPYSSIVKPSSNRKAKTGCESIIGNQDTKNIVVHRHSNSHSTLPSYSSQTFYPSSGTDVDRFGSRVNNSKEPRYNSLNFDSFPDTSTMSGHSQRKAIQKDDDPLVSSCPNMGSGSFYHVVSDDCCEHIKSPKTVSQNEHGTHLSNSFNNLKPYADNEESQIEADYADEVLDIGSVVEIMIKGEPRYGLLKWIGTIPEYQNGEKRIAGIELEEENFGCTDGTFNGHRLFECPPRKGFFVELNRCRKDRRFTESDSIIEKRSCDEFGSVDCPVVNGDVAPISQPEDIKILCGKYKGIQGHHNSCYLDATLFSMFSFSPVFDCILHRPNTDNDIEQYSTVQQVLKEEIVNPLRQNFYVRADRVMKLRKLLDELSSVSGLTSEEKDPEEFLNSLLNQIMKAEPFLKLSSGQESYFYQLFVEKDEKVLLPTVQQLFDQSFLTSDIKLKEVPSCLLIQMPRFGKQFKMYPRIIPSPYLDITDIIEDSPRQCSICGQVAEFECKECYRQFGEGLESTAFCGKCLDKSHSHQKRSNHNSIKLRVPDNFQIIKDHTSIPRIFMELFAVVCIETSHYVAFVKCGTGPDAPWCFFDSMADRRGEQNGYNIPEVMPFKDLKWWLSEDGFNFLLSTKDDKNLPEMPRRLLCDAYMCLYQSPDVMMYK